MAQQPKLTVSGYRGIWGETLTTTIGQRYASAFACFVQETRNTHPTLLIARDGRESGLEIKHAIIETLISKGIQVIDGDILPTPTVLFAVRTEKYDGAIIITASHNPIEYNGLKFVTHKALFTSEDEVAGIKKRYNTNEDTKVLEKGTVTENTTLGKEHITKIISHIDSEKIRARKFKVAVDMINASACVLDPLLFEALGVELIPLNNIPNGKFAHKPEPLRENLADIARLVKESGADIGFAQDPDADRLVVIDRYGEIISEEYTLALGVEAVLSKHHGETVVINMSTSQMNADIAEKYTGTCVRTKVGEANVVVGIMEYTAIIGGEGGGGIIYPTINTARDSFTSIALILALCAEREAHLDEIISSLPHYEMRKDKIPQTDAPDVMYRNMKEYFKNSKVNELDGLRLDFSDKSWIHLRPSNTEPIIRLIGEAQTKERIDTLFEETKKLLAL